MNYWLFKSEPETFSIDDLAQKPNQTEHWDGVRNYQARNMLRDEVKQGDLVLFYHSNCKPPGIAGVAKVASNGYPDHTAWNSQSHYFDPGSTPDKPRWYMVDIQFVKKFPRYLSLDDLKQEKQLHDLLILRKGNRLSVTPVTEKQFKLISKLAAL